MKVPATFLNGLLALLLGLGLGACHKEVDRLAEGLFVIANQSGHDVQLTVFNTRNRRQTPLTLLVPNGGRVERAETGDFGSSLAYPELSYRGDSVVLAFSDGKRLLHYCSQAQQGQQTCAPAHNLLVVSQYQREPLTQNRARYTFTLTATDYATAQ